MTINGLKVTRDGNAFIIEADDAEGRDKVEELNLALHVVEIIKARLKVGSISSPYGKHRFYVETVSGSLLTPSETRVAVRYMQPKLRFS